LPGEFATCGVVSACFFDAVQRSECGRGVEVSLDLGECVSLSGCFG
jgi:hypothetical protein